MPAGLAHVWRLFLELSDFRGFNGLGFDRIRPLDILAYAHVTGRMPERWEVRAILALDVCWLAHRAPGGFDDEVPQWPM